MNWKRRLCQYLGNTFLRYTEYPQQITLLQQQVQTLQYFLNRTTNIASLPPAEGALRKRQQRCLSLLREVRDLFREHQLTWWLEFGTLLGALRHRGFVPWDNDVDIAMMKGDYRRSLPLLKQHFQGTAVEVREFYKYNHFHIRLIEWSDGEIQAALDIFPYHAHNAPAYQEEQVDAMEKRIHLATRKLHRYLRKHNDLGGDMERIRQTIDEMEAAYILEPDLPVPEHPAVVYLGIDYPHFCRRRLHFDAATIFPLGTIEFEKNIFPSPAMPERHLSEFYPGNIWDYPLNLKIHC